MSRTNEQIAKDCATNVLNIAIHGDPYDEGDWVYTGTREVLAALREAVHEATAHDRDLINKLLHDANYKGGVQYWAQKHDKLMLSIAQLQDRLGQAQKMADDAQKCAKAVLDEVIKLRALNKWTDTNEADQPQQ